MKQTNNKKAVTVGIFVFLGLLILVAGVLTLGGQKNTFERKITVKAMFNDVGGLQVGNNVWFSGVKIGTVKSMKFQGNSQVEVVMNIEKKAQQYIRQDAKARISSEGFIGNKIVMIHGGSMKAQVVEENDILAVEEALSTDDMMATLQANNKNLLDITSNFKAVSDKLAAGQGSIGKLLNDEALVNQMEVTVAGLQRAAVNAQNLTSSLANYASSLRKEGTLTNELVTDTVVFSKLKYTVAQLQQASVQANEVTNHIKEVSAKLSDSNSPVGILLNDPAAAEDLKGTLNNLNAGTKKLDENMEALQHNFLLRGFFRKKAKREEEARKQQVEATSKN